MSEPIRSPIKQLLILLVFAYSSSLYASTEEVLRFKQIHQYAMLSNVAYMDKAEIQQVLGKTGYTLTRHGQLPGYGVGYFVATNESLKQQIIAVRGTSNIENAMVDAALELLPNKHTGIKLHQGFALSADLIYNNIKKDLKAGYIIDFTGHSLGGAAALILAMYADTDGLQVGRVITFGQPKVTNVNGSQRYAHLDVTRIVMPKDVVPLVPPFDPVDMANKFDIYWHLGAEVLLQQNNTYSQLAGLQSMMRVTDFLNDTISEENLQQHFMQLYIESLSQKLVNPKRVPYKSEFNIYDLFGG